MEKIYMENNNNKKQSSFSQVMNAQLPQHLTALMVLVAFVSFMAMGFSQESYSMTQKEFGDTFQTDYSKYRRLTATNMDADGYDGVSKIYTAPYIIAKNGQQVFCYEKQSDDPNVNDRHIPDVDLTYTIDKTKTVDGGLKYILSKHGSNTSEANDSYIETWITQNAIWKYQKQEGFDSYDSVSDYSDAVFSSIHEITAYFSCANPESNYECSDGDSKSVDGLGEVVNRLVVEAISARKAGSSSIAITKAAGEMTVTDNNYYKTQLMTVTGLTKNSTYAIKLTNAPQGTKIYKNDGNEIKDLNAVPTGTNQFYALIPIKSVTEKTVKFTVSVTGLSSTAYVYTPVYEGGYDPETSGTYQKVIVPFDENVETGIDLTYTPDTPDTGMSTAQSVYFIGLVILLCGIGIIYANIKPRVTE
ncbi:MAG: hypothetical protein E7160_03670 [Firmicutes bacterium]|nr:hypothetical protein [Bacillota bacterium]